MSSLAELGLLLPPAAYELEGFLCTSTFILSDANLLISYTLYLGSVLMVSLTMAESLRNALNVIKSETAASLTAALVSF
jgi:hypothetical protein